MRDEWDGSTEKTKTKKGKRPPESLLFLMTTPGAHAGLQDTYKSLHVAGDEEVVEGLFP